MNRIPRRVLHGAVLGAAALALLGCGPKVTIVRQAFPNPFVGSGTFGVRPLRFDGLLVGSRPEGEWLLEKSVDQRSSWELDKHAMAEQFFSELGKRAAEAGIRVGGPEAPAPFWIDVHVTMIEPGFFGGFVSKESTSQADVLLARADGVILDQFVLQVSTAANVVNAASGTRVKSDGGKLGRAVASYLDARTKPT
jgi:hypothetical protein